MLLFMEPSVVPIIKPYMKDNFIIVNFSSLSMTYDNLKLIPAQNEILGYTDEKSFDILYANWIMNNDDKFLALMKIVYPLYQGMNVIVLVNWFSGLDNYFMANMNESLMKFIQQRYGYNACIINTPEDFIDQSFQEMESRFNIQGSYNIDMDKDRMSMIIQSRILTNTMSGKEMVYGYVNAVIQGN